MTDLTHLSAGVLFVSGILGFLLLVFAVNAYRRSRAPALAFVAAAFTLFTLKSFLVGYGVLYGVIEHETLEIVDAVGDLGTVFLFMLPVFLRFRER